MKLKKDLGKLHIWMKITKVNIYVMTSFNFFIAGFVLMVSDYMGQELFTPIVLYYITAGILFFINHITDENGELREK